MYELRKGSLKKSLKSDIRVLSANPHTKEAAARTSLKSGAVVVERCPFCEVKVEVEDREASIAKIYGGIFLMDLWTFSDPLGSSPIPPSENDDIHKVQRKIH